MGTFGGLDKTECSEGLVVLNQFNSSVKLHRWFASPSSEAFHCMHEKAADSSTLPVGPDGNLANIDAARVDLGERTPDECPVFHGQEERLLSRLLRKGLSVELVQGRWWIDAAALIRKRCMQQFQQLDPLGKALRGLHDLNGHSMTRRFRYTRPNVGAHPLAEAGAGRCREPWATIG